MNFLDTVRTADSLVFSGNSPTAVLLKTFVGSQWNHCSIAVRFKIIKGKYEISLSGNDSELYILEINSGIRWDPILNKNVTGCGFTKFDSISHKYNQVACRKLHDSFRTPQLSEHIMAFAIKYSGTAFTSNSINYISAWLGIPFSENHTEKKSMFCSELQAHLYVYCVGNNQYKEVTGHEYDGKLTTLFGKEAPLTENLYTPGHFAKELTPYAPIFDGPERIVYQAYGDIGYVLLQPLLLGLIFMLIMYMGGLPGMRK